MQRVAAEGMEAKGASSSRALAGGRLQQLPWTTNPNWRGDYSPYSNNTSGSTTTTSGTTLSSPYANTPGCITPLSSDGLDPALDLSHCWRVGQDTEKKSSIDFIKCLFDDFCVADGDATVLERWLPDMGAVDASAPNFLQFAGSWTRALTEIAEAIRNAYLTAMVSVPQQHQPVHVQLARFVQVFILRLAPFVDAIVAPYFCNNTDGGEIGIVVADGAGAPTPAEKLQPLISVRQAVSRASQDIRLSFCSTSSEEAKRITDEMAGLLLTKEAELDEAIWSTMEETRTRLLPPTDGNDDSTSWWGTQTPQGSPNIHKVTRAIISYINLLSNNCATVYQIVDQAVRLRGYVPQIDNVSPFTSHITETVSCLEERLAEKSLSLRDQSFRFLFLVNNSYFIWHQLRPTTLILESHMSVIARKIDNYIETYLQVSWAPVLSCLYNSTTPLCLGRYPSSPAKFESEFQKTYAAQKLWKVPDPKLRRRLRVAVIEKVVPNFTQYLEYNNISPSRITPHDVMDMLQEIFEG
ncbi:unnamed protein product [Urochloa decumbens]|uniref:Exocyst subunit Exo70 family protein n=1 Tax=Urochloa decumbens TaxID=240449 RepID=A0ABC9E4H3_9POAL